MAGLSRIKTVIMLNLDDKLHNRPIFVVFLITKYSKLNYFMLPSQLD